MNCDEGTEPSSAGWLWSRVREVGRRADWVVVAAAFTVVSVSWVCLPGFRDEWIVAMPAWLRRALPAWLVWGTADAVVLPKLVVTWALCPLVLCACAADRSCLGGAWSRGRQRLVGAAVCFVAWLVTSLCFSTCPRLGWEEVAGTVVVSATCVLLGVALSMERMRSILDAVVAGGVVVASYALAQHLGWDPFAWSPAELVRDRSIGTMGNPDYLAAWLVGLVPWAFMASFRSRDWRAGMWCAGSAALVVAIIFSFTRAAWVALAVEALMGGLFVLCSRREGRRPSPVFGAVLTMLLCGLLLGGAMLWALRDSREVGLVRTISQIVSPRDQSSAVRLTLWKEAVLVASQHPLVGTGPGTFSYAIAPFRHVEPGWLKARVGLPGDPHNMYLELAASCGLPGLAAWLVLVGLALRLLWVRIVGDAGRVEDGATMVGLIGLLVAHFFVRMLLPSQWLVWLLVAWVLAREVGQAPVTVEGGSDDRRQGRSLSALGLAVGLVGFVLALGSGLAGLRADGGLVLARDMAREGLLRGGVEGTRLLGQALGTFAWVEDAAWEPRRGDAYLAHGKVLEEIAGRWLASGDRALGEQAARDAAGCFRRAAQSNPLDPWRRQDLGRLLVTAGLSLRKAGETAAADRFVSEGLAASRLSVAMDPYNAAILADYARECAAAGVEAPAREAFQRSLELAPEQCGVRLHFGQFLAEHGQVREAREQVAAVLEREPGNLEARAMLERLQREDRDPAHGRP